ncbi:MAG: sugar ABC transporter permease [Mesorhizobium sp.]|uniref:carbohydrate ABC transporter permease n=1 Tax=Mesorhizobium sp. TaxID=1871066 RepID=UPI000FEA2EBC|nr:sugar ABC transporter permease [Mesorhizobium sp.]RWD53502.1 MAG: sugar ABC transporter permease [Mesorhizobium sp.]RWE63816.1 MAG: sugar ABC transporter permease [Mesorhizobium sp.]RWF12621.1 MAG: sugar ABC transporter permease [Mesorhizobium sp.]RWF21320.1 MAG: sugar ABC transporter permease [Mesorhizobium sp.]
MSTHDLTVPVASPATPWRERLGTMVPILVLTPSLAASFIYVFVFTIWTLYLSLSNSSLMPTYLFVGLDNYASLWANRRWNIAYTNLFLFSGFYIVGSMAIGLLLAILIDQRVRGEAAWRTIFLYPLAVSFIVTGTVWSWLYNPVDGIQAFVRGLGWTDFSFALTANRNTAIYAVIITGIWQSSGFAMALFLAGLRSVDPDLVKAAQIDGASVSRTYRKVILPTIAPILLAVAVIQIQFAIKTFDLVAALTRGGPGVSTTFPAIYVYDLMFQRGQIGEGAAAAMMMLAALAVVLVPYSLWIVWRRRAEGRNG